MSTTSTETHKVPLAIWPLGQTPCRPGRSNQYSDTTAHESDLRTGRPLSCLTERILQEYSSSGELVIKLSSGAVTLCCGATATEVPKHVGTADLIIADRRRNPSGSTSDRLSEVDLYKQCFDLLRPGGRLVTVTSNDSCGGRLVDAAGSTVQAVRSLGFKYLQHNIALRLPIQDSQLVTSFQPKVLDGAGGSAIVHDDVCLFVKSGGANA